MVKNRTKLEIKSIENYHQLLKKNFYSVYYWLGSDDDEEINIIPLQLIKIVTILLNEQMVGIQFYLNEIVLIGSRKIEKSETNKMG